MSRMPAVAAAAAAMNWTTRPASMSMFSPMPRCIERVLLSLLLFAAGCGKSPTSAPVEIPIYFTCDTQGRHPPVPATVCISAAIGNKTSEIQFAENCCASTTCGQPPNISSLCIFLPPLFCPFPYFVAKEQSLADLAERGELSLAGINKNPAQRGQLLIPIISISVYGCLWPIFLLSLFLGLYLKTIILSPLP